MKPAILLIVLTILNSNLLMSLESIRQSLKQEGETRRLTITRDNKTWDVTLKLKALI